MGDWLRERLGERPGWMNVLLAFCAFMTFVYLPWDLFVKPIAVDEEVWFGVRFHGVLAKLLALPHWAVYAAGTVGFWRMRRWMWPWAALYTAQVALGFLVWPLLYLGGMRGTLLGVVGAAAFGALALALHRARGRFEHARPGPRERYGEWALVTGASAGIGAAFARALAAEGVSCVLTARREDRLRELAAELESRSGVRTRVVGVDLAAPGGAETLLRAVSDLEIAILVNNAGVGYAGRFDKLDVARLEQQVLLNCLAPVVLTRLLLPGMQQRGRGAVIFTGSVAGMQPLPLHGVYAATKAFDRFVGEALFVELREQGIDVIVLEPGSTATEFQQVAGEIAHPGEPPERVVELTLRSLGRQPSALVAFVARDVMAKQTPVEKL
jgi:hypothetical protein